MLLTELLAYDIGYDVILDKLDGFVATFTVATKKYKFSAVRKDYDSSENSVIRPESWEVLFKLISGPAHQYGITGTGDELKVFSVVIKLIKRVISDNNVTQIYFSVDEPSRKKLYKRMITRFTNEVKWDLIEEGDYFIITKVEK